MKKLTTHVSVISRKLTSINVKKFKRERLPEGTWISTKKFVNSSNRPVPDTMFSLFGEFSNRPGLEVRHIMIGWSYHNFRMLESMFKVALTQQKTNWRTWLNKMADTDAPGDELAMYILARMYWHVFVFTQMFWWTTLVHTAHYWKRIIICEWYHPGVHQGQSLWWIWENQVQHQKSTQIHPNAPS